MIIVGRHIEGITINPLEYVLDDDGDVIVWDSEKDAREWLAERGVTEEEMYYLVFEEVEGKHNEE